MAMKKPTKKVASKKKASASGSDRGAKMKADEAQKKSQAKSKASKYTPGSPRNYYDNLSAPKKKALGYGGKTDLAGMNTNISKSNSLSGTQTRTAKRGVDQAKRKGVAAAKRAGKK
jgi:hypothetical protein